MPHRQIRGEKTDRHSKYINHLRRLIGPGPAQATATGTTLYFEGGVEAHDEVFMKLAHKFGKPKRMSHLYKFFDKETGTVLYINRYSPHTTKNFIVVEK